MNIKHILFPVDFSDGSYALNREVEWLSQRFGAKVTLLHVFEIPATWFGMTEPCGVSVDCMQQLAESSKERLQNYEINVPADRLNRVMIEGDAAFNIRSWAEENNVDLIMIGNRGHGVVRRFLLGSVTMKLLHDSDCPIWTRSQSEVAPLKSAGISNVLCAVETAQEAVPLLRLTQEIANDFGASAQVVHCVPETESRPYKYFDMDLHSYLKECAARDLAQAQKEAGTSFPVTITDAFIGKDTAALAGESKADLIIIGRGKVQDLLGTLRTHAFEIIRQAPCAVLSCCLEPASSAAEKDVSQSEPAVGVR